MKYLRHILINLLVLLGLFLVIGIVTYFIAVILIDTFFDMQGEDQRYYLQKASVAMFEHLPNFQIYDNSGTPKQKLKTERTTYNLSFREDDDIVAKRANEFRVLLTGVSYIDGVLNTTHNRS